MITEERRKFKRFKAPDTCFAAQDSGQGSVGRIRDISMSGLAREYLAPGEEEDQAEQEFTSVDLFIMGGKRAVRSLPCRMVRDQALPPDPGFLSFVGMRARGLEFVNLSEQDSLLLDSYIHQCAQP